MTVTASETQQKVHLADSATLNLMRGIKLSHTSFSAFTYFDKQMILGVCLPIKLIVR